jgi:adenylylsulfate kinase
MSRDGDFVEVFVSCPLEVCEHRDPKGLYERARAGEIRDFTGIDAPYELPEAAELVVETQDREISECVDQIIAYLRQREYIEAAVSRASSLS